MSTNQLLKLLSVLRKRFGRRAFQPNLKEKIRAHLNSLDNETNSTTFQTKDGKDLQSSLSKTKNVQEFINHIVELRGIEKPKVILGLDGDVIYNGAQGYPGGEESFANGQYCIYTERSGSADMDFPEVVSPPSTGPKSSFGVRH